MRIGWIDSTHGSLWDELREAGHECVDLTHLGRADLLASVEGVAGVVVRSRVPIDAEFLERAGNLRFVARVGAGMENIDVGAAEARGVRCLNAPEGNRDAVGEHGLGMLLALLNHLPRADREVRAGQWRREENRGVEVMGKTVGLVGYGNTGRALARRLVGFGCRVLAYDKYLLGFSDFFVRECGLAELQATADIVSFHVPESPETVGMFDMAFIEAMGRPFYLLNTSRGRVVRTEDLLAGIASGKVLGAALDVLEMEGRSFERLEGASQEVFDRLRSCEKVLLSPHVAGWTVESELKLAKTIAEKIKYWFPKP